MNLVDSHCHIDDPRFDADREMILQRARDAGVTRLIVPGVSVARWKKMDAICAASSGLYPAFGLHPMFLREHRPEHLELLRQRLETGAAVAVGECGLDYSQGRDDAEAQRAFVTQQLALAREFDLPVILHARGALEEVIQLLRKEGGVRGVVHSFSGSEQQARQLWELDFQLGIGGAVTHQRAQRLRPIVANMPIEHLLLETDAPDQPGTKHRGERNEPAWLLDVLRSVAALRGEDEATLAAATSENARRLFKLG